MRTQGAQATVYLPGGQEITATAGELTVQRSYTFAGQVIAVRTGASHAEVWSMVADPHNTATVAINNDATPAAGVVKRRMDPFANHRGETDTTRPDVRI